MIANAFDALEHLKLKAFSAHALAIYAIQHQPLLISQRSASWVI